MITKILIPFYYLRFLYYKIKYRKTFGPWIRWSIDEKTRRKLLMGDGEIKYLFSCDIIDTKGS